MLLIHDMFQKLINTYERKEMYLIVMRLRIAQFILVLQSPHKRDVNFAGFTCIFMFFFSFALRRCPHVLIMNLHINSVY